MPGPSSQTQPSRPNHHSASMSNSPSVIIKCQGEVRSYQLPSPKHSSPPSAGPRQSSLKRKADAISCSEQGAQPPPLKRLALTYCNLKGFQESSRWLPTTLDEVSCQLSLSHCQDITERLCAQWSFVLTPKISRQEMSRPPVAAVSSSQSQSQGFTDEIPAGPLQKDPERYALELDKDYGILFYDYLNINPKVPTNLEDIRKALTIERDDTPTVETFRRYCQAANKRHHENVIGEHCQAFLGISNDDGAHGNDKVPCSNFGNLLPPGQKSLTPDLSCGLSTESSDIPS